MTTKCVNTSNNPQLCNVTFLCKNVQKRVALQHSPDTRMDHHCHRSCTQTRHRNSFPPIKRGGWRTRRHIDPGLRSHCRGKAEGSALQGYHDGVLHYYSGAVAPVINRSTGAEVLLHTVLEAGAARLVLEIRCTTIFFPIGKKIG